MIQVVKPRCRYVADDSGKVVGWLLHGFGINCYSIKSIDHAISHWYGMAIRKILKQRVSQ
jgi:hypothetical protein